MIIADYARCYRVRRNMTDCLYRGNVAMARDGLGHRVTPVAQTDHSAHLRTKLTLYGIIRDTERGRRRDARHFSRLREHHR